jgi:hypothetical protein
MHNIPDWIWFIVVYAKEIAVVLVVALVMAVFAIRSLAQSDKRDDENDRLPY